MNSDGGRVGALDLLRGVTVCSMIAYHACWDLVNLFGRSWAWFDETPGFLWQQSICWTFLLLSGFCWGMSRHAVRRGLIVFAFRSAKDGFLGFGALNLTALPKSWYANLGTAFLGFPPAWFYSSDYFPVFPWLFLFAAGYFLYRLWAAHGRPLAECCNRPTPLHTVGRHSLLIYLLHQPLLFAVLSALARGGLL